MLALILAILLAGARDDIRGEPSERAASPGEWRMESLVAGEQSRHILPLRRHPDGHFTLDVFLGQPVTFGFSGEPIETISFILDTGASHTALAEPLAAQLGFERRPENAFFAHGLTGPFLTESFPLPAIDFGLGPRAVNSVVLLDGESHAFRSGGLIGMDAFSEGAVLIDFPNAELREAQYMLMRGDLQIDDESGLILGTARARGLSAPVHIMVDTGSSVSFVNPAFAGAKRVRTAARDLVVLEGVTVGETANAERRTLVAGLTSGELCMDWFFASVVDAHAFDLRGWSNEPAMILGMDVLQHAQLRIDFRSGRVDIDAVDDYLCEARDG